MRYLNKLQVVVVAATVFFLVFPVLAHHSEAGFDTDKVVAFVGTVVEYSWRNPHVYIDVEKIDSLNGRTVWEIETGATPIMRRSGWSPESLVAGDVVSIRAHPERDTRRNYALLISLEKENGDTLSQTSGNPQFDVEATSFEGIWKGFGPSLEPFRRAFNQIPLTKLGLEAKEAYNFYEDAPAAACVAPSSPHIISTGLYITQIELMEGRVIFHNEFFDAERIVYMDGRGHPAEQERSTQGHSIGWWEGNVLVVDTTHFSDHRIGNGVGVPSGPQKHLVERYRLSEDRKKLMIEVTLTDPEYLLEPFTGSLEWRYTPEFELFRYDCDFEVSRRFRLD
ncbi:MAG: DUF6152 family protein [Pseudomonadota bacterium]|nr:DUF6152 family protein [Pseudomonadota bacterium]